MDHLKQLRRSFPPNRQLLVGGFCVLVLLGAFSFQVFRTREHILPRVSVGGIPLSGLTKTEAKERLKTAVRGLNFTGLSFSNGGRTLSVKADEMTEVGGVETVVLDYDIDATVEKAFAFGHQDGISALAAANLRALFTDVMFQAEASLDKDALKELLVGRFGNLEHPAKDADVRVGVVETMERQAVESGSGTRYVEIPANAFVVEIIPETGGTAFDFDQAIDAAARNAGSWKGLEYHLTLRHDLPAVRTEAASAMRGRVAEVLEKGALVLAYDDKKWEILPEKLAEFVTLKARPGGDVKVGLRDAEIVAFIDQAASEIESSARPTILELDENGRASKFEGGSVGKTVNRVASIEAAEERLNAEENAAVPLVVDIYPAGKSSPIAEELGIRELVGYGTSNFAGSPKNRRLNIANGARLLDGWIIKPGEEFGLIEKLKPFNAKNGYLQELVIKERRTVPEYGGGLCQIGTTTFRAVMGAGLPVSQRQNHSYRVRYYEPAGTDATIYDPAPDFKFINDTSSHMLLKTMIVGDILRFEFWGTRDGRVQEQGKVKTWATRAPPPPNLIETSELAEGQKKCFEVAHAGATTNFTYTITYPDGRIVEKDFTSVYKPWQEQCLIGKAGAARVVLARDGSITVLPPEPAQPVSATATPAVPPAVQ